MRPFKSMLSRRFVCTVGESSSAMDYHPIWVGRGGGGQEVGGGGQEIHLVALWWGKWNKLQPPTLQTLSSTLYSWQNALPFPLFLFTAWVGSIAMMGIGIYGPVIGRLYHRFGARIVSFFGLIICAVSLVITSWISNLYVMYFTYGALFGFGSCGVFLVTFIAMPRYFVKWRSLSLGLIAMGPGGGLFIMSPIVQALFESFG